MSGAGNRHWDWHRYRRQELEQVTGTGEIYWSWDRREQGTG